MPEEVLWILVAVAQLGAVIVVGMVVLRRPPAPTGWIGAAALLFAALLVLVSSLAWLATGGPDGRSALPMRGGLLGFWLSMLTVAEAAILGILLLRHR
jgi:hypothetical protein